MSELHDVPAPSDGQPEATRWHLIVGVLGLVYGILGFGLYVIGAIWMAAGPKLMAAFGFKDIPPMPNAAIVIGQMVVTMGVGLALIFGCIALLRRNPRCVALLQFWVVARLLLVVIGLIVGFLTLPTQLKYSKDVDAAVRAALEDRQPGSSKNMPPFDEERQAKMSRYGMLFTSVVVVAFPLFIGILMTSKKKRAEIESWSTLIR